VQPAVSSSASGAPPLTPDAPRWVNDWVGASRIVTRPAVTGPGTLTLRHGWRYSTLRFDIDGIDQLAEAQLEDAVRSAYSEIGRELSLRRRHPIRFWNFLPGIQAPAVTAPERYMLFNRGRLRGFESWFVEGQALYSSFPAASSIGTGGSALIIHCLAAPDPGWHVENPRQTPAYRYSARYGPVPPSFARATVASAPDGGDRALVAGTASVLGEETAHHDDLEAQTAETVRNMASIVRTSLGPVHGLDGSLDDCLDRFENLRVHLARAEDMSRVSPVLESRFRNVADIEFCQAELCRSDLLVEVEGVATLTG